jgi:hypothetical protein
MAYYPQYFGRQLRPGGTPMKGAVITWMGCDHPTTHLEIAREYRGVLIPSEKMILYLAGKNNDQLMALRFFDGFIDEKHCSIITLGPEIEIPYPMIAAGNIYLEAGERLGTVKIEFAALAGYS